MRQTTLSCGLRLVLHKNDTKGTTAHATLLRILQAQYDPEELAGVAVLCAGAVLKHIAELLLRCHAHALLCVHPVHGLIMAAKDPVSERRVHVRIGPADLAYFAYTGGPDVAMVRGLVQNHSLYAICHQLKRRDIVLLYATHDGRFGTLVDYSGAHRSHVKHSSVAPEVQCTAVDMDALMLHPLVDAPTPGVCVPSAILQRIYREYKNSSKRLVIRGNACFVHFAIDPSCCIQQIENVFGHMADEERATTDDAAVVALELATVTLGRAIRVAQLHPQVTFQFQGGDSPCLYMTAVFGAHGSRACIILPPDQKKAQAVVDVE